MRVAIVGYGRAGRIQHTACRGVADVVAVVDARASVGRNLDAADVAFETSLARTLADATLDAVVVTTPTATHFDVCRAALEADKHVFVEKPLAGSVREVEALYELAARRGRLLYTAYNRRHDPEWCGLQAALAEDPPTFVQVVCRDFPFPPAAYLQTCGGILRDAAVHDFDMLCRILCDTPIEVHCTLDEAGETAATHLVFARGCRAHLVHSRHSTFYDQRVVAFGARGAHEIGATRAPDGTSFDARYRASYAAQMGDFVARVARGDVAPNVTLGHALLLERLVEACDASAAADRPMPLQTLRAYEAAQTKVRELYRAARAFHTVERVRALRSTYAPGRFGTRGVWEVLRSLAAFTDLSDPDVDVPNDQHALQTAEAIRRANLPDWLQLVGLIHDFGKVLYEHGTAADGTSLDTQWSLVGDTFVVGCALPDELVYPEFNADASEVHEGLGVYRRGCGLDACDVSFGHDEYLYQVLRASVTNLPSVALRIVRYHSLYAWHDRGCYSELESEDDALLKGWVKLFNQHDLYSKRQRPVDVDAVRPYYEALERKYLPNGLAF